MISRGIDTAAKGMMSLIDYQDSIANNLANVNTNGYKREGLTFRNVYNVLIDEPSNHNNPKMQDRTLVGEISLGSATHKLVHEFSQGTLTRTGAPLDLAIEGDGFFKVRSPQGDISYTRDGAFLINSENFLIDLQGNQVLDDQNNPIRLNLNELGITTTRDLSVNENGTFCVTQNERSQALQTIQVVDFLNKEDLRAIGHSKYVPKDPDNNPEVRAERFSVQQGALELSNSNVITEMINSINVSRNYETLSKFVKETSTQISTAINIGRLKL